MLPRSSRRYETYRETDSLLRRLRRLLGFVILLFLAYELVTTVLVQSIEQESVAMRPTLEPGDRLFVLPLAYGPRIALFDVALPGFGEPERGDLVSVRPAYMEEPGFAAALADPFYRFFTLQNRRIGDGDAWRSSLQIKRVIGIPGDTIQMERFVAYIKPAGGQEFVSELALTDGDYELVASDRPGDWRPLDPFGPAREAFTLDDDEYYVLADNRSAGVDSRHWGVISSDRILARLSLRYWPLSRFGGP
jgi:signal peptidase I